MRIIRLDSFEKAMRIAANYLKKGRGVRIVKTKKGIVELRIAAMQQK